MPSRTKFNAPGVCIMGDNRRHTNRPSRRIVSETACRRGGDEHTFLVRPRSRKMHYFTFSSAWRRQTSSFLAVTFFPTDLGANDSPALVPLLFVTPATNPNEPAPKNAYTSRKIMSARVVQVGTRGWTVLLKSPRSRHMFFTRKQELEITAHYGTC